jgi:5-methylcytosine-specific restriction endonuclease McrA
MKYTEEELIEEIHRISEQYCDGETPRQKDIDEYSEVGKGTYYTNFKSWNDALMKAGFKLNKSPNAIEGYNFSIKKSKLIEEIERIQKEYCKNRSPMIKDVKKHSDYPLYMFRDEFGSWNKALEKAGFDKNVYTKVSRKEFLKEIKRISQEYSDEKAPTRSDFEKLSKFSTSKINKIFGSWTEAVREAGFKKPAFETNIPDEKLISEINRVSENYCKDSAPTEKDMIKHSKYSIQPYVRSFGSWNEALQNVGFEPNKPPSGKEHGRWAGGYDYYYGSSWKEQRRNVLERDDFNCRICAKSDEEIGRNPDVHHIVPIRFWKVEKEHEKMNHLRNLVSLCPTCHHKLEGKFKGRNHDEFEDLAKDYLDIEETEEKDSIFDY